MTDIADFLLRKNVHIDIARCLFGARKGFEGPAVHTKQPCYIGYISKVEYPSILLRRQERHDVFTTYNPRFMTESFNKGGRPPVANKCSHCVKVRFDDLEWDELSRMMEKANATVKATFIKQLIFGKPFRVLNTDKSLAVYCAKLSEFFCQYRTIGVNYNLVVKELRANFTEKKAMASLYKLEKATIDMIAVMTDVMALSEKFDEQWSQKSR